MAKRSGLQQFQINQIQGVNITDLPFRIADNQVAFALNVDIDVSGTLKQRKGFKFQTVSYTPIELFNFREYRDGLVNEYMLGIYKDTVNSKCNLIVYNDTTNDFDLNSSSDLTLADNWYGIGYVNKFIFTNQSNVYLYKYDSATSSYVITDITNNGDATAGTVNPPQAQYWEVYANRVFACGDGTENIYWSNISDVEIWDANDFLAIGAKPNSLKTVGQYLFIGTDRGLFKLEATGDSTIPFKLTQLLSEGVLPNTLVEVRSGIVGCFLVDGRFVMFDQYAQSGSQLEDKYGYPIQDIINYIGDKDKTIVISDNVKNKLIFCFTSRGFRGDYFDQTIDYNLQLVLDKLTLGWTFYNIKNLTSAINYNDKLYCLRSGEFGYLDEDTYLDNADFINTVVETKIYDFGSPEIHKNFRDLYLNINSSGNITIDIAYRVVYELVNNYTDSKSFVGSGGYWDFVKWDEFIWDGILNQIQKSRIYLNGKALQIVLEKQDLDADFQLTSLGFTFYPSYKQGRIYK